MAGTAATFTSKRIRTTTRCFATATIANSKLVAGGHGEGSDCHGASADDMVLKVPVGTVVFDSETGEQLFDFTRAGQRFLAARGGRGGRGNGNPKFVRPWHQAPREHEDGHPGQERHLRLELKLLADVGLVGFPNAGKSTLISRISAARPKIAAYPFTTLEPHLGVVSADPDAAPGAGRTFVVADLPGLIEGAHEGAGLGTRFLKHIERTRLIAHLVDTSDANDRDPVRDFEIIEHELASFSPMLAEKPMIVVATKLDATTDRTHLEELRAFCAKRGLGISRHLVRDRRRHRRTRSRHGRCARSHPETRRAGRGRATLKQPLPHRLIFPSTSRPE